MTKFISHLDIRHLLQILEQLVIISYIDMRNLLQTGSGVTAMHRPSLGMRGFHLVFFGKGEETFGPVKCSIEDCFRQRVVDDIHKSYLLAGIHDLLLRSQTTSLVLRVFSG